MVFFSIPYDFGWKATVNGVSKPVERVNYGFAGILLEPGSHKIELKYEPPLSKWGWLGVLAAAMGVAVLYRFRKSF